MSKKLIIGLALVAVLISGSFIGAKADNIGPQCWAGFCPAQPNDTDQTKRDMDKKDQTKRDMDRPYRHRPITPEPFGSPGV